MNRSNIYQGLHPPYNNYTSPLNPLKMGTGGYSQKIIVVLMIARAIAFTYHIPGLFLDF
ncbi:MAG: hypothetical protein ACFB02_11195 [Mastigocoleus sp.]